MRSDITVFSSICGGKDDIIDNQPKGKYVMFLDRPYSSETWEIKKAYDRFKDPRRNSRIPKLLSHQFIDTEYSLWIDGNLQLLSTPDVLVERYLKDHDIAVFKHPTRDCIYGEAAKCAVAKLDDPEVIIEQVMTYEKAGYAKNKGLCECMFILRRHTRKVQQFNDAWWSEYSRHSCRDQISFMYAADKVGLRVNAIDMDWILNKENKGVRGDIIKIAPHVISNPK